MKYIELAPGIRQYTLQDCDIAKLNDYIHSLQSATHLWRSSITMGDLQNYRTSTSLSISNHKHEHSWLSPIDKHIFELFNSAILQYQSDFDLRIANDEGYEVLRYGVGQGYKKHIDQGGYEFGRILSGLLYVNDNYVGGQLEFTKLNLTIQPTRGTILLFPSNFVYEHIAHPIQQGEKIAIVTFFHPEDEMREKSKYMRKNLDPHGAFNL